MWGFLAKASGHFTLVLEGYKKWKKNAAVNGTWNFVIVEFVGRVFNAENGRRWAANIRLVEKGSLKRDFSAFQEISSFGGFEKYKKKNLLWGIKTLTVY